MTAKTRFVIGPARMTAIRFQVCWRQYACGESPSSISWSPRSRPSGGSSPARLLELLERRPRGIVVLGCERALQPLNGPASSGCSRSTRPKYVSTSPAAGRCMPGIFT